MALAIDGSTPARFAGTPGDNVDITSASFTPPSNSVIVATVQADTNHSSGITISVSDSLGGTWVDKSERDKGDAGAQDGHASVWVRTTLGTGAAMTISVRRTTSSGSSTNRISVKVYVDTGENTSTPAGTTGKNSTTTNNSTAALFNTTGANSHAFLSACDWNQLGSPVSSDGIEDSADYAGGISVMSAYELQGASGNAADMNIDCGGSGASAVNWAALEILEAAGAAAVVVALMTRTLMGAGL